MSNFAVRHVLPALAALSAAAAPLAAQDKQQQPLDINSFEAVKALMLSGTLSRLATRSSMLMFWSSG